MKKLILVVAVLCIGAGMAIAATTGAGTINVACTATVVVEVSTGLAATSYAAGAPATMSFGSLATGGTFFSSGTLTGMCFKVWNNSAAGTSAVQKYSLSAVDGIAGNPAWTFNTAYAGGADQLALAGYFDDTGGHGAYDATDTITNAIQAWDGTHYWTAASGYTDQKHGNITAGTPTARNLWIAIKTPSATSSTANHPITLTVTAALVGT
jgi:hypothetical protein